MVRVSAVAIASEPVAMTVVRRPSTWGRSAERHGADGDAQGRVHQRERHIAQRMHLGAQPERGPGAFGVEGIAATAVVLGTVIHRCRAVAQAVLVPSRP